MQYAFSIDETPILSAQEVKVSKIANIPAAIMRRKISFTDNLQTNLNYARRVDEEYAQSFVDMRVPHTLDDMMS